MLRALVRCAQWSAPVAATAGAVIFPQQKAFYPLQQLPQQKAFYPLQVFFAQPVVECTGGEEKSREEKFCERAVSAYGKLAKLEHCERDESGTWLTAAWSSHRLQVELGCKAPGFG